LTFFKSSGISTLTSCTLALPPLGSAAKDFGRTMTSFGFGPDRVTSTICWPPKIWVCA
jgi:hypothetical protein